MESDRLNRWLTLVANVGVLIGIIFLAIEIRQNSEHLALQLEFEATQKIFENNRDMQDANTALVFSKAITRPDGLTFDEGLIAASFILNLLGEWEDRFFIYEAGLIDESEWQRHIEQNLVWTLGNQFAMQTWETSKEAFEPGFVQYLDSVIGDVPMNGTEAWWAEMQSAFPDSAESGN